jgi:predicted RNA-binding protein with PUA-like domain
MSVGRVIYWQIMNSHEFIVAGIEEIFQKEVGDVTNFPINSSYHDHQGS